MLSGKICVTSDTGGGIEDLLKPWKTSQRAAAVLYSCEHALKELKRALWPQTRPGKPWAFQQHRVSSSTVMWV